MSSTQCCIAVTASSSPNNFNNKILNGTLTKPCLFWNDWFGGADEPLWTDPTLSCSTRFGNIMIWEAPAWSLASPEFTHGFPKRLIVQEHGGFLPGNITVSAKASNLTLRRLAVCDVACLVSQATTAGSGLSRARLLNLRYAAISYQGGSFCPQYLASAMVEFGVNFATFEALSADTLDTLHASLKRGWRQGDDSSGSGEESNEPLISCPQSVMQEIGKSSAESSLEAGTSQQPPGISERTMLSALLAPTPRGTTKGRLVERTPRRQWVAHEQQGRRGRLPL